MAPEALRAGSKPGRAWRVAYVLGLLAGTVVAGCGAPEGANCTDFTVGSDGTTCHLDLDVCFFDEAQTQPAPQRSIACEGGACACFEEGAAELSFQDGAVCSALDGGSRDVRSAEERAIRRCGWDSMLHQP